MKVHRWNSFKPRGRSVFFSAIHRVLMTAIGQHRAGTDFSQSVVNEFQSGTTTCDQVAEKLGKPFGVSTDVEGRRLMTWCYAGRAGARAVAIAFSNEDIMERVVAFCEIQPS